MSWKRCKKCLTRNDFEKNHRCVAAVYFTSKTFNEIILNGLSEYNLTYLEFTKIHENIKIWEIVHNFLEINYSGKLSSKNKQRMIEKIIRLLRAHPVVLDVHIKTRDPDWKSVKRKSTISTSSASNSETDLYSSNGSSDSEIISMKKVVRFSPPFTLSPTVSSIESMEESPLLAIPPPATPPPEECSLAAIPIPTTPCHLNFKSMGPKERISSPEEARGPVLDLTTIDIHYTSMLTTYYALVSLVRE
ncbi:hypothetical protein ABEB36_010885 [Hypothenemus hampei]|uniref:Uncharacterized protein n=1 Tax=Hypothenemus hampei TaxID=57062 RepID=A0ABD1EDG3_HYPHA